MYRCSVESSIYVTGIGALTSEECAGWERVDGTLGAVGAGWERVDGTLGAVGRVTLPVGRDRPPGLLVRA